MDAPEGERPGELWPSADYARQLRALRAAVGRTVYLVELAATPIHLGIRQTGQPHVLVDVIEFARPDPARGLAPHMIVLDDGRGINLGQLLRISLDRPFDPAPAQVLYQDDELRQQLLLRERRLSREFIAQRARLLLGHMLGRSAPPGIAGPEPPREIPSIGEEDHREEAEPGDHDQQDDQGQGKIFEGKPVAHRQRSRQ
ncbi:hypothetical protein [Thioalkalivibrio sp.]|uniref:hypothetical protein n=1 Tax=Thioalkalivibrio sp. TaxID=2093813 RepID=UPI0039753D1A